MQLALVTRRRGDVDIRLLAAAAAARGHTVSTIDPRRVLVVHERSGLRLASPAMEALADGELVRAGADVLWHRYNHENDVVHAGRVADAVAFTRGVPLLNRGQAVARAASKSQLAELLTRQGVTQVPTYLLAGGADPDMLASTVGLPLVLKGDRGALGVGVYRADTVEVLETMLARFADAGPLVAQPWEPWGAKVTTALVVAQQVVGVVTRVAEAGAWRATRTDGRAEPDAVTDEEETLAVRAVFAAGLDVAGVELLRSPDGPVVLDVNPGPAFEPVVALEGSRCLHAVLDAAEAQVVGS